MAAPPGKLLFHGADGDVEGASTDRSGWTIPVPHHYKYAVTIPFAVAGHSMKTRTIPRPSRSFAQCGFLPSVSVFEVLLVFWLILPRPF